MSPLSELGTGRSIMVATIVLGCFAILWPKVFYPMLFDKLQDLGSNPPPKVNVGSGRLGPDHRHPRFQGEEGRELRRTLEKDLKPGPVPGMRPTMGGPGIQPQGHKGQGGAMSVLMPLYTVGIVVFFLFTIMKIIFKKNDDDDDEYAASSTPNTYDTPKSTKRIPIPESASAHPSRSIPREVAPKAQVGLSAKPVSDVASPSPVEPTYRPPTAQVSPREEESRTLDQPNDDDTPSMPPGACPSCKTCQEEMLMAAAQRRASRNSLPSQVENLGPTPLPTPASGFGEIEPRPPSPKMEKDVRIEKPLPGPSEDTREEEIQLLRQKLQETEKLMKLLASQVDMLQTTPGNVPASSTIMSSKNGQIGDAQASE